MKKFIAWITSMRLAIGLITYLAATCILATLVPQGLADDGYLGLYPRMIAQLVILSGFGGFFGSVLFIIPSFLFFANLSACTVKRLVRELRKKGKRHFGPDILHVGLMILFIGSVWSSSEQWQRSVMLAPGDGVNLPDGAVLYLDDFRFERYADGRPRDWVSVVSIFKDGKSVRNRVDLRVNSPLRYQGLTFYQASYDTLPGGGLATGIEAVSDPGYPLVFMALALIATGTALTFTQKLMEGV